MSWISWLVDSRGILLDHEDIIIHRLKWVHYNIILTNAEMECSIYAAVLRVKVYNDLGGIGIHHKEAICTNRDKGRVYVRMEGARICVGARFQYISPLIGVDDV